jgi:NAD-dependent DNA ligase
MKKHVAMTGKWIKNGWNHVTRENIRVMVEDKGYIFDASVTNKTDILLCQDKYSGTVKIQKAIEKGIEIINYSDFFSNLNERQERERVIELLREVKDG